MADLDKTPIVCLFLYIMRTVLKARKTNCFYCTVSIQFYDFIYGQTIKLLLVINPENDILESYSL